MATLKIERDINGLLEAIDSKLDEVADDVFFYSQQNIVDQGLIDRGTLLKSGNINREFLRKQVIYSAVHAEPTEFGRLPGSMPPVDSIKEWVKRKGLTIDDKKINSIAWAISMDIKQNGIVPRPYLRPAVEKKRAELI